MFKERSNTEFQPYKMAPEISRLEQYMWDYMACNTATSASVLRDRFQYLMTVHAVIRSESMYLADLSDLCDFMFQQSLEPDPYHIFIMRIGNGKINQKNAIFGRVMRHRDPRLCPVGGVGLVLLARFHHTREIETIDFTNNKSWFNIKLLGAMNFTKKTKNTKKRQENDKESALKGMYKCCSIKDMLNHSDSFFYCVVIGSNVLYLELNTLFWE